MIARMYLEQDHASEAERYARECLEIRQQKTPDDWRTFSGMRLLGRCLAGQKKYADAEPLLQDAYRGMVANASKMPTRSRTLVSKSLESVIQLYEDWGQPDEAEKWRKKRDQAKTDEQRKTKPKA
jgi:hypothetical protein